MVTVSIADQWPAHQAGISCSGAKRMASDRRPSGDGGPPRCSAAVAWCTWCSVWRDSATLMGYCLVELAKPTAASIRPERRGRAHGRRVRTNSLEEKLQRGIMRWCTSRAGASASNAVALSRLYTRPYLRIFAPNRVLVGASARTNARVGVARSLRVGRAAHAAGPSYHPCVYASWRDALPWLEVRTRMRDYCETSMSRI
jgi:hypothetical protein